MDDKKLKVHRADCDETPHRFEGRWSRWPRIALIWPAAIPVLPLS